MSIELSDKEEQRYAQLQMMALDFARNGEKYLLEDMLKHGLNVDLATHKGDTLIMLAAYNGNYETVKMLIDYGANIDKRNDRGQTPLEGVCFKGYFDIVKLLVENGAGFEGNAIIYASIFGQRQIVDFLKREGVDKNSLKFMGINIDFIVSLTSSLKKLFRFNKKKREEIRGARLI